MTPSGPDEGDRLLLERALWTFGDQSVSDAVAPVRAIVGPAEFPDGEELANEALRSLRAGRVPRLDQRAALEAMMKIMRPALLSKNAVLEDLPPYNRYAKGFMDLWSAFRDLVSPQLYSVGRIDRCRPADRVATGFLVSTELLVTNRHVVQALTSVEKLSKGQAVVRFKQEYNTIDDDPPVPVLEVVAVHPALDLALLQVQDIRIRVPMGVDPSAVGPGHPDVVIGYPARDSRNPLFVDRIFQRKYHVKRAAPGLVTGVGPASLYHDCSTLGGNSGSPVLSMRTGRVVGVHCDGPLFLYRNEAVDAPSLAEWVGAFVN